MADTCKHCGDKIKKMFDKKVWRHFKYGTKGSEIFWYHCHLPGSVANDIHAEKEGKTRYEMITS